MKKQDKLYYVVTERMLRGIHTKQVYFVRYKNDMEMLTDMNDSEANEIVIFYKEVKK